jgi:uroporphyrinogen-III decarboxylase
VDYVEHNSEVERVWSAYRAGDPIRVPMILGISAQYNLSNEAINPDGVDFKDYCTNADLMMNIQMRAERYRRFHIPADYPMGPFADDEGCTVSVDFQNYHEAAWFGCPIVYKKGLSPYAIPFLSEGNLWAPFDKGIPEPFSGIMGQRKAFYEYFQKNAPSLRVEGARVHSIEMGANGTDGPFTIACCMRGADRFCLDLYERPEYAKGLLSYICDATIARIQAMRLYQGQDRGFFMADDSIALISPEDYREFVLPVHKRLADALSDGVVASTHLCGASSHQFRAMVQELGTRTFDTGFPIDHAQVLLELGREICIQGGPPVSLLLDGTGEQIERRVEKILDAVKALSKKFILRDGNNVSPHTPVANIRTMYEACRKHGKFS